jgi:Stigma-specific protein, Stig1
MNTDRIDTLARSLITNPTRRGFLGWLAGAACGSLTGLLGLAETDAHRGKKKHRKRRKRREKQETCVPNAIPFEPATGICARDRDCCGQGRCCTFQGDPGETQSACYDLLTHTTACGTNCESVVNCFNFGQDCCGGVCADLQTDAANCGACGNACRELQVCSGGVCRS